MILTLRETGRMREFATRLVGAKAAFSFSDIMGTSPVFWKRSARQER